MMVELCSMNYRLIWYGFAYYSDFTFTFVKVSELENKMRQQQQFESESLNNKVP